jgi:hypothetical protein
MGAYFSRATLIDDLQEGLARVPGAIASVDADLEQLAEHSATEMKDYIGSRGTDYSRSQGRLGRVDPSRKVDETMQDAVSFRRIPKPAPTVYIWEFGWFNFVDYYSFQEKGFMHAGENGQAVAGMFALRDASTNARVAMHVLGPEIVTRAIGALEADNSGWV